LTGNLAPPKGKRMKNSHFVEVDVLIISGETCTITLTPNALFFDYKNGDVEVIDLNDCRVMKFLIPSGDAPNTSTANATLVINGNSYGSFNKDKLRKLFDNFA